MKMVITTSALLILSRAARSVLPSSSAVNWASMLMGVGPELHGLPSGAARNTCRTAWGRKLQKE